MTISEILDQWGAGTFDAVSDDASDKDILHLARLAVIIAGNRAQTRGDEELEEACTEFIRATGMPVNTRQQ